MLVAKLTIEGEAHEAKDRRFISCSGVAIALIALVLGWNLFR